MPAAVLYHQDARSLTCDEEKGKAADFNGIGKVSCEKFRNRDGRIAADEHPSAVDKNGNPVQPGVVTVSEFTASARAAFKAADKHNDGQLSLAEWMNK